MDRTAPSHSDPTAVQVLRNRTLLTIGSLVCIGLFYGASRQFHIPAEPGYSASLLQQTGWIVALLVTAIGLIVATLVGSIITSRIHRDAGLFCAAIGLATLSCRGGPMRDVLFEASNRSVYLMLAAETIALAAMVTLAWTILEQWPIRAPVLDPTPADPNDRKYLTTLAHTMLMIGLMSLLCRSDDKGQVLASVGLSSFVAALGAQWFSPVSPSPWLFSGTFIVALVGYISCYFTPAGIVTGRTSGYFAALARPLPLDYASAGVAGALLGYWMGVRRERRDSKSGGSPD